MRAAAPLVLLLVGCASGQTALLEPISPQTAVVNETLLVPIRVESGKASGLSFDFRGPDLPNLGQTTSLSPSGGGAEFRWTPVASHVGTHEFVFLLLSDGAVVDEAGAVITVIPAGDAAPVFLSPGAGGTFDLAANPCVSLDLEVRDEDSLEVDIRAREPLPEGADLGRIDGKRASLLWCPSEAQVAQQERWTLYFEADDGEHAPTPHDFVVVLRPDAKSNCPGTPPLVTITGPAEGAKVSSEPGYTVSLTVSDDVGLRDVPLVYFTTTTPDDPSDPDLTAFELLSTVAGDVAGTWTARIPSLGLAAGEERAVYVVGSATDNDDPAGPLCDLTTDTALRKFVAVGSNAVADACAPCSNSTECGTGICAEAGTMDRCGKPCSGGCGAGACGSLTTTEGAVVAACAPLAAACGTGGGACNEDAFEPNDTRPGATPFAGNSMAGQVCAANTDFYRTTTAANERVSFALSGFDTDEGDLDLALYSEAGALLDISDSFFNTETVTTCATGTGNVYAAVYGYQQAENPYVLTLSKMSASCCVDDAGEPDDSFASARALSGTDFEGTICPGDDDLIAFDVTAGSRVEVTLVFDDDVGDLDLALLGPSGSVVASSLSGASEESISYLAAVGGKYAARVRGFAGATGEYLGTISLTAGAPCTTTKNCASGAVCSASVCVPEACETAGDCPAGHTCAPEGGSASGERCAVTCTVNSDCRSAEACKRTFEGRLCDRAGAGQNGDVCTEHSDCGGQRACLGFPGGYCARAGCSTNADCESGTFCVAVPGGNACAKDCANTTCRASYTCVARPDAGGASRSVCVP